MATSLSGWYLKFDCDWFIEVFRPLFPYEVAPAFFPIFPATFISMLWFFLVHAAPIEPGLSSWLVMEPRTLLIVAEDWGTFKACVFSWSCTWTVFIVEFPEPAAEEDDALIKYVCWEFPPKPDEERPWVCCEEDGTPVELWCPLAR